MTRAQSPVLSQRHVLADLRAARDALNLTQKEVADALDWSVSKIQRIEQGTVGLSITDLKALLLHYGITDRDRVETYVQLAKRAKASAWWDEYRSTNSSDFVKFLGLEASAIRIRQFQLHLVPGLLQVHEYARPLLQALKADMSETDITRQLEQRAQRQKRLEDPELEQFFILDESVLRRRIADVNGWRAQLHHLREAAEKPNISIQILQFGAGWVSGMQSSFDLLQLSEQENDLFLSIEQPDGDQFFDDVIGAEKAADFMKIFFRLEEVARPAADTPELIDRLLSRMEDQ